MNKGCIIAEFLTRERILFHVIFPTNTKYKQFEEYTKLRGRIL